VGGEDSFASWLIQVLAVLIAASWYFPVQLFRRYNCTVCLHPMPIAQPTHPIVYLRWF
jgi:hypothetical protein